MATATNGRRPQLSAVTEIPQRQKLGYSAGSILAAVAGDNHRLPGSHCSRHRLISIHGFGRRHQGLCTVPWLALTGKTLVVASVGHSSALGGGRYLPGQPQEKKVLCCTRQAIAQSGFVPFCRLTKGHSRAGHPALGLSPPRVIDTSGLTGVGYNEL